jgi:competence protein ComEA
LNLNIKELEMKIIAAITLGSVMLFGAVDINNATKDELMSLKGLGAKKAEAVIEYRKENCFKDVNALTEIKGIGPKFIEANKKNLQVGKCKVTKKKDSKQAD